MKHWEQQMYNWCDGLYFEYEIRELTQEQKCEESNIHFDNAWDTDRWREHLRNKVEEEQGNDTTIRPHPLLLTDCATMRRRKVSLTSS
jgi:predicted adenine nucleotide alpha hydrolase (AANH) superfamily ATPase